METGPFNREYNCDNRRVSVCMCVCHEIVISGEKKKWGGGSASSVGGGIVVIVCEFVSVSL